MFSNQPRCGFCSHSMTSWPAFGYGRGLKRTAFTTLKMAVLAPIPSASVNTATKAKPGLLRNCRNAKRRSCARPTMSGSLSCSHKLCHSVRTQRAGPPLPHRKTLTKPVQSVTADAKGERNTPGEPMPTNVTIADHRMSGSEQATSVCTRQLGLRLDGTDSLSHRLLLPRLGYSSPTFYIGQRRFATVGK